MKPSATISSGGGRHDYWILRSPLALDAEGRAIAKRILRSLAAALGADMASAEPARVLRLPGSWNLKYSPPREVRLNDCEGHLYTVDQCRDLFAKEWEREDADEAAALAKREAARAARTFSTTPNIARVERALAAINPDADYMQWLRCGMGLRHEFGEAGLALWDCWSQGGAKYDAAVLAYKWRTFGAQSSGATTIRTVFQYAKYAGADLKRLPNRNGTSHAARPAEAPQAAPEAATVTPEPAAEPAKAPTLEGPRKCSPRSSASWSPIVGRLWRMRR